MKTKTPEIGIALDSGGAKGGAHIGVMDVLLENGLAPRIITGSSAGALVGALYASGRVNIAKDIIEDLTVMESLSYYMDPVFPVSGLLAGKKARNFINELVGDVLMEDLDIKLVAVATDLLSGETVSIDSGPLVDAVMASVSMPGIFKPTLHTNRLLTDGGVSDPLPIDILKTRSPDITIACNLHPRLSTRYTQSQKKAIIKAEEKILKQDEDIPSWMIDRLMKVLESQHVLDGIKPVLDGIKKKINMTYTGTMREIKAIDLVNQIQDQLVQSKDKLSSFVEKSFPGKDESQMLNIFEIMLNATNIQQYQKNRLMLVYEPPDVLISPDVTDIGSLEFSKVSTTIDEGRRHAEKAVPEIKRILAEKFDDY